MAVVIAIERLPDATRFGIIVSFWIAILGTHRNQSKTRLIKKLFRFVLFLLVNGQVLDLFELLEQLI